MTTLRARNAVMSSFVVNGFAFASWVSRIPDLRDTLSLSPGRVGLLLLCLSAGTVLALPLSGLVVHRWVRPAPSPSGRCSPPSGCSPWPAGSWPTSVPLTGAALFAYGAGTSSWDVAMNVEAADVERAPGALDHAALPRRLQRRHRRRRARRRGLVAPRRRRCRCRCRHRRAGGARCRARHRPLPADGRGAARGPRPPVRVERLARAAHPGHRPGRHVLRADRGHRQRLAGARHRRRVRRPAGARLLRLRPLRGRHDHRPVLRGGLATRTAGAGAPGHGCAAGGSCSSSTAARWRSSSSASWSGASAPPSASPWA